MIKRPAPLFPGPPPSNDYFTLEQNVGPGQPNRREDVIRVETILGNTGHHDLSRTDGPLGYWGERQEQAVRNWQSQKGLKVDGLLKPGGPTITSLKQAAGGLLGGFTPPSPDEVDEHHSQRMQGEPGLLNTRPARLSFPRPHQPLDLDEQSQAFNADTAGALTRSSVNGHIPDIYANFAKQAGPDAHATLMDLAEQMNSKVGRDRTDQVMHGIVKQLPPDQSGALVGGAMPPTRPLGVRNADLPDDSHTPLFRTPTETGGRQPTPAPPPKAPPHPDDGPQPDVTLWDKRRHDRKAAEHRDWYETHGKQLEAEIAADPSRRRLHPSESFIWTNLKRGNNGYKTNGEGLIFGYDRGGGNRHNAEIEVWDKNSAIHQFTIDPITGKKTKGPDPRKNRDKGAFGALEFPVFS